MKNPLRRVFVARKKPRYAIPKIEVSISSIFRPITSKAIVRHCIIDIRKSVRFCRWNLSLSGLSPTNNKDSPLQSKTREQSNP